MPRRRQLIRTRFPLLFLLLFPLVLLALVPRVAAQEADSVGFVGAAELMGWGNLSGIRLEGELVPFETSLHVVRSHWDEERATAKERRDQQPQFSRVGSTQVVTALLDPISLYEFVSPLSPGSSTMEVGVASNRDTTLAGVYFVFRVNASDFADGSFGFDGTEQPGDTAIAFASTPTDVGNDYVRASASGLRFGSDDRSLQVSFAEPSRVIVRDDTTADGELVLNAYVTMMSGEIAEGDSVANTFTMTVSGMLDREPIEVVLDAHRPGRVFDGLGGNFRLQNPKLDPDVIDYNLENLRVAWGRVEMPWQLWQPEEDSDPLALAESGTIHPRVAAAMEMARELKRRGMPVIVSAWFPPDWAVNEPVEGLRGRDLNPDKMELILKSIGDYLEYLKRYYGVEAVLFSFNESDLGIDIRQTAEEHATFIKALGERLTDRGLATKLLLGDTSDARPIDFVKPALLDKDARPYIGAVSFHSWRGWEADLLEYWGGVARLLNVPLLVGEGSTDAAAWTYPAIFSEYSFALHEINLYTRILAISQPRSILQWQLTSDYSLLRGGGLFGVEDEPLSPTHRFWNLKQLASTPPGAFWLPVSCSGSGLSCAAFGDIANGAYAVHLVNNGAERTMTLSGLPDTVASVRIYVTDSERAMELVSTMEYSGDPIEVVLPAAGFTTLLAD